MTLRISTHAIFDAGSGQLNTLQSQMAKTQMQLSTNKRMITAADDPIAAAHALEITQSQSMNTQFGTNRTNAKSSLSLVDKTLTDVTAQIQGIQALVVTAGNGAYTKSDREALATELEGRMQEMLGSANTADGTGGYLFSGYKSTTQPYTLVPGGADYQGDQGQRSLQVGSARKMPISESGNAIFDAVSNGNGAFVTAPGGNPTNTQDPTKNLGSGIIDPGSVVDASKLLHHDYTIAFSVSTDTPPVRKYAVTDNSISPPTPQPLQDYKPGAAIKIDGGITMTISGDPADQDTFSVKPSEQQSVFTTISNLIDTLRAPADGSTGKAELANSLALAGSNMKNALDNVLTVQASVGSRMKELDNLDNTGGDLNIQYASTLSDLQDLDMAKTISLFAQQQTTLQAAQMSFKTISGLSLFNYIT